MWTCGGDECRMSGRQWVERRWREKPEWENCAGKSQAWARVGSRIVSRARYEVDEDL